MINKILLKVWLKEKKTYKVSFKQTKTNYFIIVDKTYLRTILELFDAKNIFDIYDQKSFIFNAARFYQLFCNCQVVNI